MERYGITTVSTLGAAFNSRAIDDRLIQAGAFADDLISATVRYQPSDRIPSAEQLATKVRQLIARFDAGGHALDLRLPQRCLFCGNGLYRPFVDLPPLEKRLAQADTRTYPRPDIYADMRERARYAFGHGDSCGSGSMGPLILICDYCGNVQEFRLDIAQAAPGNWRP